MLHACPRLVFFQGTIEFVRKAWCHLKVKVILWMYLTRQIVVATRKVALVQVARPDLWMGIDPMLGCKSLPPDQVASLSHSL